MSALFHIARGSLGGKPTLDVYAGTYKPSAALVNGGYKLEADGDVQARTGATTAYVKQGEWISPVSKASGSGYQVRATLNSGTLNSGTTGTWMNLSSIREWTVTGTGSVNMTVEIRDPAGIVQDSGTVIITGGGSSYGGDSFDMTVGDDGGKTPSRFGYSRVLASYGTVTDDTLNIWGTGTDTLTDLVQTDSLGTPNNSVILRIDTTATVSNSGWTNMNIDGVNYARADGTFFDGGTYGQWTWPDVGGISYAGSIEPVEFT